MAKHVEAQAQAPLSPLAAAIDAAIVGEATLTLVAGHAVALAPKARVGEELSAALVRAANVMCVRQFRNNIEAKAKALAGAGKPALTAADILKAWDEYDPDVSADSLLEKAALRVGAAALGVTVDAIKPEQRDGLVAKVCALAPLRARLIAAVEELIAEAMNKAPRGKRDVVDISKLDALDALE